MQGCATAPSTGQSCIHKHPSVFETDEHIMRVFDLNVCRRPLLSLPSLSLQVSEAGREQKVEAQNCCEKEDSQS